ncbi:fructosamine kinase family protein [Psychromarinibacter sp. C21-152]|uniref:Fructosamine kinase family protein n=1 Tax=Psychromarinibacter sediminicola TaxID=3033385 RepID=A0AAE3NP75_9RHOB|nr:fructosamine kinase family protein [Psychromarinibacter sediminicola]MDF0599929.1 fructosamine kinase family protein [Psychromarinibacter sediminicola]
MSALADSVARLTGVAVEELSPLSGGDLSSVAAARLADGRAVVVKTGPLAGAEAEMLRAIAATGCPCPAVLAAAEDVLVMTRLADGGRPDAAAWAAFGEALRRLHDAAGDAYGWPRDHAFGPVTIRNAPRPDWPAFWAERRLTADIAALPADLARRVEALAARLPDLLPAAPPAALLHGDLWSGNVLWGPEGFSGVIDPACYHGHAEVDLAMLGLFGRLGDGFRDGHGPAEPGEAERRPIYQLWPALVHLRLFGGGYRGMVERLLAETGA